MREVFKATEHTIGEAFAPPGKPMGAFTGYQLVTTHTTDRSHVVAVWRATLPDASASEQPTMGA